MTLRGLTIGVSLAGLPFILPHVVEDFVEGVAVVGPALLGAFLAVQMMGLVLVGRGRRLGWAITSVAGLVWVVGALVGHAPAIASGAFRTGGLSVVWVLGLIATQATAAVLALRGWRRSANEAGSAR